jgi:hypothetical protein
MNTMHHVAMPLFAFLHCIACLLLLVGVLFLILWAVKTMDPKRMKTTGIWMVVVGGLLCLLTFAGFKGMHGGMGKMRVKMMDGHMMEMDHGGDMMGMSMDDMAAMLEGKTGDAFDKAFLEGMIPHHQGAIDMARAAKASAKHQEIKDMADDIIEAQQREIDMMRAWMEDWGY